MAVAFGSVHIGLIRGAAVFASTWRTLACLPRSRRRSSISIHAIALAFLLTVGTVLAAFTRAPAEAPLLSFQKRWTVVPSINVELNAIRVKMVV